MASPSSLLNLPHLQPVFFFPPPPLSPLSSFFPLQTPYFPRCKCSYSSHPSMHQKDAIAPFDDEDHVIGDCLVFEDDAFDDPYLTIPEPDHNGAAPNPKGTRWKSKKKKGGIVTGSLTAENLIPDEWKEVQAEINITKKERRKIAQEMEFNSRVERKKQRYLPIRSINLEEYKAYREAKLAQLKPIVLDDPVSFKEEEKEEEQEEEEERRSERVAPRNPRWAVYGKGFEDVKEFLESQDYVPADQRSEGMCLKLGIVY